MQPPKPSRPSKSFGAAERLAAYLERSEPQAPTEGFRPLPPQKNPLAVAGFVVLLITFLGAPPVVAFPQRRLLARGVSPELRYVATGQLWQAAAQLRQPAGQPE